ncbi:hypothetical protein [Phenylobacterium sp.]|jgi:hypothetical protein|uniref:hypothetical protein n=1 Tax=Phenylobacterium sp. TaxID=1871053 RepID=UPI0035AEB240
MLLTVALVALLVMSGETPPSPSAPAAPAGEQTELKPGERKVRMICRNEQKAASRLVKRRCMSVEDWKQQEEDAQRAVKDIQDRREINPPCLGSGRGC